MLFSHTPVQTYDITQIFPWCLMGIWRCCKVELWHEPNQRCWSAVGTCGLTLKGFTGLGTVGSCQVMPGFPSNLGHTSVTQRRHSSASVLCCSAETEGGKKNESVLKMGTELRTPGSGLSGKPFRADVERKRFSFSLLQNHLLYPPPPWQLVLQKIHRPWGCTPVWIIISTICFGSVVTPKDPLGKTLVPYVALLG